jgi:hypothetical protein
VLCESSPTIRKRSFEAVGGVPLTTSQVGVRVEVGGVVGRELAVKEPHSFAHSPSMSAELHEIRLSKPCAKSAFSHPTSGSVVGYATSAWKIARS